MSPVDPLPIEALYKRCDPDTLSFETTADLRPSGEPVGQQRAIEALDFGLDMEDHGYHIYVMGATSFDARRLITAHLQGRGDHRGAPSDWVYVHNFDNANAPHLVRLSGGWGARLQSALETLGSELQTAIPATFESDEYRSRLRELQQTAAQRQSEAFGAIEKAADEQDIAFLATPSGFTFAPKKSSGEVLEPSEFNQLSDKERERIEERVQELQTQLQEVMQNVPRWNRELQEQIRQLNSEMASFAIGHPIGELRQTFADFPRVVEHLDAIESDIVDNVGAFLHKEHNAPPQVAALTRRYGANLLVDHGNEDGAPLIYEDLPTMQRLVGRIEHVFQQGALLTDFTLIKPGALHQANGGYLLLDAYKLLTQPFAWEGLKRALTARQARIESPEHMYSVMSTVSLEPEPMPLDLKVILLGNRQIYYLLAAHDPDFTELFKIQADLEDDLRRTPDSELAYAAQIASLANSLELRPLERGAVARTIEHASRLSDDGERLTARLQRIEPLLQAANHAARLARAETIAAGHVQSAIDAEIRRASRIHDRINDEIRRGVLMISTSGTAVGQVNGLSVMQLGTHAFGRPTRITATARLGRGQVVDIEREVELGGSIHSKGILILSAFLGARFARSQKLSLSASLTFEQSYGMVDGDSASVAELCALLSALAGVPLRQDLAVTGSVNQRGEVQAVGGVNEKIEGFFAVCRNSEPDGNHGVLLPATNVAHLMLAADVVEAAGNGRFAIYPIRHVDEAIALLTGMEAGEQNDDGVFPEGTFNRRVADRLAELASLQEEHANNNNANGQGGS